MGLLFFPFCLSSSVCNHGRGPLQSMDGKGQKRKNTALSPPPGLGALQGAAKLVDALPWLAANLSSQMMVSGTSTHLSVVAGR